MNKDINEIEYELSPEEEAFIDRALRETADAANRDVDFGAIHDSILKKARGEGISVFAKPAGKKSSARRVWTGVAAAAAVFVVGLAVIAVLKNGFGFVFDKQSPSVSGDEPNEHTVAVSTDKPGRKGGVNTDLATALPTQSAAVITPKPTENVDVLPTSSPVPDEYPTRDGGWIGYTILNTFTTAPAGAEDLIPEALPDFMLTKASPTELSVKSYYMSEYGEEWIYTCTASELGDTRLGVGAARFTVDPDGSVRFVWRVTETCWLDASFKGFEFDEAWDILLTLPLCAESVNSTDAAA